MKSPARQGHSFFEKCHDFIFVAKESWDLKIGCYIFRCFEIPAILQKTSKIRIFLPEVISQLHLGRFLEILWRFCVSQIDLGNSEIVVEVFQDGLFIQYFAPRIFKKLID